MTTKKTTTPSAPTLLDLSEKFIQHLEKIGKSPGTCFSYAMDLKLALAELGEQTPITDLTTDMVKSFFDSERVTRTRGGMPKAPVTIRKTQRVMRFALQYAVEQGLLESDPLAIPDAG